MEDDTSLKGAMERYNIFSQQYGDLIMLKYYENLSADNKKTNMQDRKHALHDSDASTRIRYVELTNLEEPATPIHLFIRG